MPGQWNMVQNLTVVSISHVQVSCIDNIHKALLDLQVTQQAEIVEMIASG